MKSQPRSLKTAEEAGAISELKDAFRACGPNADGMLDFDGFYALLQLGNVNFPEKDAAELFRAADLDLSGELDFGEFVDFIYDQKELRSSVAKVVEDEKEEKAKERVLQRALTIRKETAAAVREAGADWKKLPWTQRWNAIKNYEMGKQVLEEPDLDEPEQEVMPPEPEKKAEIIPAKQPEKEAAVEAVKVFTDKATEKEPEQKPPPAPKKKSSSPLEGKTQAQIVDYSIHKYDLTFAGSEPSVQEELEELKAHLKTAAGPPSDLTIAKYLAKGTQGWVFMGEWKKPDADGRKRVAVKAIRMTQALGGVKEWYISKLCRQAGIENIVFTSSDVYVITRSAADPIIEAQLRGAGPVEHYVCLIQDFMPSGTLENLVDSGNMTPKTMFGALEDVSRTLAMMHENSLAHRDVKPENVLLEMEGDKVKAAKLCDLGSAEIGGKAEGYADDVRRLAVTMFSLATGEGWTKNRLLHEKHDNLVSRLKDKVADSSNDVMKELPNVLAEILSGDVPMKRVAEMMTKMKNTC